MYCIIYGVVTNEERIPTSFLFAARHLASIQHVAENHAEAPTSKDDYRRLAMRLFRRMQRHPPIPTDREAVWGDPMLVCHVHYEDHNGDGTLIGAAFEEIFRDQTGQTAQDSSPHYTR